MLFFPRSFSVQAHKCQVGHWGTMYRKFYCMQVSRTKSIAVHISFPFVEIFTLPVFTGNRNVCTLMPYYCELGRGTTQNFFLMGSKSMCSECPHLICSVLSCSSVLEALLIN